MKQKLSTSAFAHFKAAGKHVDEIDPRLTICDRGKQLKRKAMIKTQKTVFQFQFLRIHREKFKHYCQLKVNIFGVNFHFKQARTMRFFITIAQLQILYTQTTLCYHCIPPEYNQFLILLKLLKQKYSKLLLSRLMYLIILFSLYMVT